MPGEIFEYKTTALGMTEGKAGAVNLDEAQGIVECFVAGIGNKDSVGDIVASGAFTKSLMRRKPRVVWGHNWNDPIGKVLEIYEVPPTDNRLPLKMKMAGIGGLFARVQFNLQSEKGREAFANVAFFGEEQEWSIGYKTLRAQYDQKSQANVIFELELYEVSPVLHGANQLTGTISVKSDDKGGMMTMAPMGSMEDDETDEIQKQLSMVVGSKVMVENVSDDMVSFSRREDDGKVGKYKCHYSRGPAGFMFGPPQRIVMPPKPMPTMMPMSSPGMPSAPERIMRPSQMPGIPVAIKPGEAGMQVVPLPPVDYEDSDRKPRQEFDPNNLDQEEADLRDALLKITKRYGKFNEDSEGVWAGYKSAAENPVKNIGVKCANCVFFKGGNSCQIIDMEIESEGKCRFAVIPKGVVKGDVVAKKSYEYQSEADEEDYLEDLEVKYPGELVIAALRGAIGRKRKKRRKYKSLADFGRDDHNTNEAYCIPVMPQYAFRVKQALDPIFDYHYADAYVDPEGIVITSGVSYELIEAVDTALDNLKKKSLTEGGIEEKAIGYRLGRAIGSRMVDRPNLGGGRSRGRFFTSEGAQDFNPFTARDVDLDGVVGEGLFMRGTPLAQADPTPNGPGSIRNPKPSPEQLKKPGSAEAPSAKPAQKLSSGKLYEVPNIDDPDVESFDKMAMAEEQREQLQGVLDGASDPDQIKRLRKAINELDKYMSRVEKMSEREMREQDSRTATKLSSGYQSFLKTPANKRNEFDKVKYNGPLHKFKEGERLSSGKVLDSDNVTPEEQKQILDDVYAKMTDQIIAALEEIAKNPNSARWEIPWRQLEILARNATGQKRVYQGTNQLMLTLTSQARGYKTNRWAGAGQWKKLGGKIGKEAMERRGVQILAPNKTETAILDKDGNVVGSYRGFHVTTVWNVADVDGLPPEMYELDEVLQLSPEQRLQDMEDVIKEIAPDWKEVKGNRAFYSPMTDSITMPQFEQFKDPLNFYSTLFHETVHWTSHPSRMNRKLGTQFGDADYAFEELVAEIGSAFALGSMGVEAPVRKDHAPYLASWLKALRDRPDSLKDAITQAQQAVDFLMNRSATMRKRAGIPDNERKGKEEVTAEVPMIVGFEDSPKVPTTGGVRGTFGDEDIEDIVPPVAPEKPKRTAKGKKASESIESLASGAVIGNANTPDEDIIGGGYIRRSGKDGLVKDVSGRLSSGANRGSVEHRSGDAARAVKRSPGTAHFGSLYGFSYEPTEQQKDIIDTGLALMFGEQKGIMTVSAGAGSGKTTTLKALMAAAEREFDITRFLNRPEALKEKLDFISEKYSTDDDKFNLASMSEADRDAKLDELRNKFKSPTAYYVVFNKKNEEEAAAEFSDNTGVSTLNRLSWWSLLLGQGDEKYGKGFRDKVKISTQDRGTFARRDKDGKLQTIKFTKVDGTEGETIGYDPGWRDLGYIKLSDSNGWIKALKLTERDQFATGKGAGMETPIPGVTLTVRDYADILNKALKAFANSADEKIGPQHFKRADINKGRASDSIVDTEWPSIPEAWIKDVQDGWDMVTDANSIVLPDQGQTDKLWAMTDPDLRSDPGLIGHATGKDLEANVQVPKETKVGDVLSDGRVVISVKAGQKGKNFQATVARRYATEDNPLSMFMIDEAQDMNPVMEQVLNKNRDNLSILLVGDKRQAVYAFRGAKDILSSLNGDYDLPLNESFRYGPTVAWLANLIQAQGNIDDEAIGIEDRFHHVAGLAVDVINNDFDMEGLSPERAREALAKIESKYKADRIRIAQKGVRDDFDMSSMTVDQRREKLKNVDKKYKTKLSSLSDEEIISGIDINKALSKELRKIEDNYVALADMDEAARTKELESLKGILSKEAAGEIVADMKNADAILTRDNATIIYEALQFIQGFQPRYTRNGQELPPVVMIPATKHREMKAFFEHLSFVMDTPVEKQIELTKKGLRPKPSSWIGDVWDAGEIKRRAQQEQYAQLKSMYKLVTRGNKNLGIPPRKAWEYRNMFAAGVTPGVNAPVIVPERKMLNLAKLRDVTAGDLRTLAALRGTGYTSNASNSRARRFEIIPDTTGKGKTKVQWHLQLAEVDGERTGEWTGAVEIFDFGMDAGGEYTDRNTGKVVKAPQGPFFRDLMRILEDSDYYGGKVSFKKNGVRNKKGAGKEFGDAIVIKGDTPEETAFILTDITNRVRQSAKTPNADVEITTAQLSKGREWDSVRIASDFRNPPELDTDPNTGNPVESRSRREELNIVYVALTRAKRRIDPGQAIYDLYLKDASSEKQREAIDKAIADGRMPEYLRKPEDLRDPYSGEINVPQPTVQDDDDGDLGDYEVGGGDDGKSVDDIIKEREDETEDQDPGIDGIEDVGDEDSSNLPDTDQFVQFLSSGRTGRGRRNRRLNRARQTPWSDEDRQRFADGDKLRANRRPGKRNTGPSAEEFFSSGRTNVPLEGRFGRRIRRAGSSAGGASPVSNSRIIAGLRLSGNPETDARTRREMDYAMRVWDGFKRTGIALDVAGDDANVETRQKKIKDAMREVSERMSKRPQPTVGNVSSNNPDANPTASTWMLSVDRLKDAIRIPTEYSVQSDPTTGARDVAWTQSRSITNDELASLLNLDRPNASKLSEPGAGVSHDTVRMLIAELGKQPEFAGWRLFAPVTRSDESFADMNAMERFSENLGRANMRDRFIIETFGKDAFPYWFDEEENRSITSDEYDSLGEVSRASQFRASGRFDKDSATKGDSPVEEMLMEESIDEAERPDIEEPGVSAEEIRADKTSRQDFDLDSLLKYLGIPEKGWQQRMRERLQQSFGTDDVGLGAQSDWKKNGVPVAYINQMIKSGVIPNASAVWRDGESGSKLDSELENSKHVIYEALNEFIDKSFPNSPQNNTKTRNYLTNSTDMALYLSESAKRKGSVFSPRKGDEPRFSGNELQQMVNRFNEVFGTNHTIEDLFSREQLETARKRIEEDGETLSGKKRERRKVKPNNFAND